MVHFGISALIVAWVPSRISAVTVGNGLLTSYSDDSDMGLSKNEQT